MFWLHYPALDQPVEHCLGLLHVADLRQSPPDRVDELLPALERSLPHGLVADDGATRSLHLLNRAQAVQYSDFA
jgi:hypothetical protein